MQKLVIDHRLTKFVPENWNELTPNQLRHLGQLLSLPMDEQLRKVAAFKVASGLRWRHIKQLAASQVATLVRSTDFLLQPSKLIRNPYPVLRIRFRKFYGLADAMTDIRFEQYLSFSETYLAQYMGGRLEALPYLLASLYSEAPGVWDAQGIEKRAKLFLHLPHDISTAVLMWHAGCRQFIQQRYPDVFPPPAEGGAAQKDDPFAFLKLLNSLNSEHLADNSKIRQSYLYDALEFITARIKRNQELEFSK